MRITLEYDPVSGNVVDKNGIYLVPQVGLEGFEPEKGTSSIVMDLVEKGVNPDDIIRMKNAGLL